MSVPPAEIERLAEGYLRHARTRADEDFWAFDAVGEVVHGRHSSPEAAWDMVQALLARVPPDDAELIEYVAAGPVEDLVREHGAALVDWIEGAASRDPHFRAHLAGVWLSQGDLPPEVESRIMAASDGAIQPLPPDALPSDEEILGSS